MEFKLQKFDSLPSTNSRLREDLIQGSAQIGAVYLTQNQPSGRGRLDRTWETPSGNIAMSVACPLYFGLEKAAELNLVAASSVMKHLEESYSLNTFLKWPNDVWIGDLKICGILSEIEKDVAVIGIGLNFNSLRQDFPEVLQPIVTTLREETQKETDLDEFVQGFFKQFSEHLSFYEKNGLENFIPELQKRLKYLGDDISVSSGKDQKWQGQVQGLSEDGYLVLQTSSGLKVITAGDVHALGA